MTNTERIEYHTQQMLLPNSQTKLKIEPNKHGNGGFKYLFSLYNIHSRCIELLQYNQYHAYNLLVMQRLKNMELLCNVPVLGWDSEIPFGTRKGTKLKDLDFHQLNWYVSNNVFIVDAAILYYLMNKENDYLIQVYKPSNNKSNLSISSCYQEESDYYSSAAEAFYDYQY